MRGSRVVGASLLALVAAACASTANLDADRAALLKADQEWSAAASSGDVERIVGYWTDDARVYSPGEAVVAGKAAIREMVAGSMKIPGFRISWTPKEAVVGSGGLGYTTGENRIEMSDSAGKPVVMVGRYATVWRKEADGRWRCVIDMWNEGPAAGSAGVTPAP